MSKSVQNNFYSNFNKYPTINEMKAKKNDTTNDIKTLENLNMHHETITKLKKMLSIKNKEISNHEVNLKLGEHLDAINKPIASTKSYIASLNLEFSEDAFIGLMRNATLIYNKSKDDYLIKRAERYVKEEELTKEKSKYYYYHMLSLLNKIDDAEKGFKELLKKNKDLTDFEDNKLFQSLTLDRVIRSKNITEKPIPMIITKSGHYVRSKAEKIIADIYFDKKIRFRYEPHLELDFEMHPDFYLEDFDVYHEHFGMTNDEEYSKKADKKIKQYKKHDIKLIITTNKDEADIERILSKKIDALKKK